MTAATKVPIEPSQGWSKNGDGTSRSMLVRLLKISALLAVVLVVTFSVILTGIELKFQRGDMNSIKNFESLDNPYQRVIKDTIPTVQQWYWDLEEKDLLAVQANQWPVPEDEDATCVHDFFETLSSTVTHTSPDLVKIILHVMGLSKSAVVKKHLRDLILKERELSTMYTQSSNCLQSNIAIAKIACDVEGQIAGVDPVFMEYLINEAVVLDALTEAMYQDLSVTAEVVQVLLDQLETRKDLISKIASSIDEHEFMVNKYEGIVYALKRSINDLATNSNRKDASSIAFLQNNILEAVKLDIINGHDANAGVGLILAANVGFSPVIEDHQKKWALGQDWVNAYISWNFAFVMSLKHVIPSKLLIPSVACTATHSHGEDFIHRRTLSLAASYLGRQLTLDDFELQSIDTQRASKILRAYMSLETDGTNMAENTTMDSIVQLAGEANVKHVVLTSPSSQRIEDMLYNLCDNSCHGLDQWKVSQTSPVDDLDDNDYQVYMSMIVWVTVLVAGLGSELSVWLMFLQSGWNKQLESRWKMAQFVFPLFAVISLGLAVHQNYMALLFLVLGLHKFGFPETLLYMYSALYVDTHTTLARVGDFIDSVGTGLHHASASLLICVLVGGVIKPSRHILDPIVVLVIQHWFVLLQHVHRPAYILIELLLEIWFEWSVLSQFEVYTYKLHWTVPLAAAAMLVAHWLYVIAACIGLFADRTPFIEEGKRQSQVAVLGMGQRLDMSHQHFHSQRLSTTELEECRKLSESEENDASLSFEV